MLAKDGGIENTTTTSQTIDNQSHVSHKEKERDQHSILHQKVDTLVSEFRKFRLQSKCEKDKNTNHSLLAAHPKCANEVSKLLLKWPEINECY